LNVAVSADSFCLFTKPLRSSKINNHRATMFYSLILVKHAYNIPNAGLSGETE